MKRKRERSDESTSKLESQSKLPKIATDSKEEKDAGLDQTLLLEIQRSYNLPPVLTQIVLEYARNACIDAEYRKIRQQELDTLLKAQDQEIYDLELQLKKAKERSELLQLERKHLSLLDELKADNNAIFVVDDELSHLFDAHLLSHMKLHREVDDVEYCWSMRKRIDGRWVSHSYDEPYPEAVGTQFKNMPFHEDIPVDAKFVSDNCDHLKPFDEYENISLFKKEAVIIVNQDYWKRIQDRTPAASKEWLDAPSSDDDDDD